MAGTSLSSRKTFGESPAYCGNSSPLINFTIKTFLKIKEQKDVMGMETSVSTFARILISFSPLHNEQD